MNRFGSDEGRGGRPRRRWRRAVAAATLGVLAIAATGAHAGGNTLEVVSFYPEGAPDYQNLEAISTAFKEKNPGTDVGLVFGGGQNAPNIVARWRAGNPPEVNVGFFGPGVAGEEYAKAGQVFDLTAAMNQPVDPAYGANVKWKDTILPPLRRFLTLDGHYYAAPREVTALTFFYNRKLFDKYHLQPPKTWQEFLTVSAALKKNGVAPLTVTGTFAGYMQMYYDFLLARRAGVKAVTEALDGTTSFASVPGAVDAAKDLQTLVKNGYFLKGFQGTDFTAAQINFFRGKAAMILMGTWLVGEMKGSIPKGFAIGTFPFPTVPGGKGDQVLFGAVNDMTVAKQSKNPQLGVAWLKTFSQRSIQAERVKALDYISPYKGVPVGTRYKGIVAALEKGGSFATSYFGVYGRPQAIRDAYQQPIVKLFFGKTTPQAMVDEDLERPPLGGAVAGGGGPARWSIARSAG